MSGNNFGTADKDRLLSEYLGTYVDNFDEGAYIVDELWDAHDEDGNNLLDQRECKLFLDAICHHIDEDRARNYDRSKFKQYFKAFDDDNNGFLDKEELSIFLKQLFGNPRTTQ